MTIKNPKQVYKSSIFKGTEHLQLLLSSVLCTELDQTQHGTTLNKCRVLCEREASVKQRSMKSDFLLCLLAINILRENVSIYKHWAIMLI